VKETLKILVKHKVWLEITNLIIPTLNDSMPEIEQMARWISEELGRDVPLHFSRFFPLYKLENLKPTPESTLENAKQIADKYLDFVYVGNLHSSGTEDTYCPSCGKLIIRRLGFEIVENHLKKSSCEYCKQRIAGFFG
jgi:pyruvate formate lyase activating enzyme